MLMQNLGVSTKEHYGMLWYFLEWSIPSPWVKGITEKLGGDYFLSLDKKKSIFKLTFINFALV